MPREVLIDKVIFYSFSRYARSVTHLLKALEEFKKLSVGFVSITESIDTNTPLGSEVFTFPGAVVAEVRAMKTEKVILEEEMAIKQEQAISKNQDIQFELIRF